MGNLKKLLDEIDDNCTSEQLSILRIEIDTCVWTEEGVKI